ncbi:MAG: S-adenosylmethionine:tRNA ribosyltransferase-isomerase, partial [Syntrophomonadaceae bacterium]|nr:S-adenosylmethionine:tRNA ribosyltransferase-isomerase [Syntrophomonadaceae bacterium]
MTDTQNVFKKSAYEFQLPSELIAKYPSEPRDISRLLILNRNNGNIEEKIFTNIKYFLTSGDALVINETKVMPARLLGVKTSGAQVEILLLRQETFGIWEALVKPARRLKAGAVVEFPPSPVQAEILEELEQDGGRRIKFHNCADFLVF